MTIEQKSALDAILPSGLSFLLSLQKKGKQRKNRRCEIFLSIPSVHSAANVNSSLTSFAPQTGTFADAPFTGNGA
jgi:hypothetical protein